MIAASIAVRFAAFRGSVRRHVSPTLACLALLLLPALPHLAVAQAAPPAADAPAVSSQPVPEVSARDETPVFKVKVNLVEVRVVVRDSHGNAIGNLKQEDFVLLDNGKPQIITRFSAEKAGDQPVVHQDNTAVAADQTKPAPAPTAILPNRYVAYFFDDIHLGLSDLALARTAALHQLPSLQAGDRVAIFTTSGQGQLDFTDDKAQLKAALDRLIPRPLATATLTLCPNISYYMADLIQNKQDQRARQTAAQDAWDCAYNDDPAMRGAAQQLANSTALQVLAHGDTEVHLSFSVLKNLVRRMSALPGERIIIMVSPGFTNPDDQAEETEIMEKALGSKVVINTLDARALYTDIPDASVQRSVGGSIAGVAQEYLTASLAADADVLADFASTTGGTFFHNNNDLDAGFRLLGSPPAFSYLLGFAPQNLKLDGHFHKLKVELKKPAQGIVQARKGYYAPRGATDPNELAKQAIEDAVFSQEEVKDIPVELHTQFFKPTGDDAKLSVVVRVDVRSVHFRKVDGRNNNDVTVVSALFDHNGNFVNGNQKVLQLHLKDETLQGRLGSGITLKSSFDVKPGSYIVRLVVRDEDGQLAAQNSAVEIP